MAAIRGKWEVESLIGHRLRGKTLELLILYKGFPSSQAEWQHVKKVREGANESVEEYFSKLNVRNGKELSTKMKQQKNRQTAAKRQQRKRIYALKKATTTRVTTVQATPPPMAHVVAVTPFPAPSAAPASPLQLTVIPVSGVASCASPTTVSPSTVASASASSSSLPASSSATDNQPSNTSASKTPSASTGVLPMSLTSPSSPSALPVPVNSVTVTSRPISVGLPWYSGTGSMGFSSVVPNMPRNVGDIDEMKSYQLHMLRKKYNQVKKENIEVKMENDEVKKKIVEVEKENADLKATIEQLKMEAERKFDDQQVQDNDEEMEE